MTDRTVLLLGAAADDDTLAARLGHLLEHVSTGTLREDPTSDCDVLVAEALDREASAYALELRLRDAFALGVSPYIDLERTYREDGLTGIRAYLENHPNGGPGIDGLGAGYRSVCEQSRVR